jgi:RNA polymerase sigma-70 factor, ECF subfamily
MMPDDRHLMRRIRRGDERAFAALVQRHGGRMLAVAAGLLGSRADGEDAVQRAFLRVHAAASAYRAEWAVSTWLYRILTNVCLDELRRRRSRPEIAEHLLDADGDGAGRPARGAGRVARVAAPSARGAGQATRVADAAAARLDVTRALARVPTEARVLLVLRYADGLSYGELARVRGISLNTVKSQLARGKSILRAALMEVRR